MRQPAPVPLQRGEQDGIVRFGQSDAAHHHAIQTTEPCLRVSEAVAGDPLEPVARHGGFGDLAGNGQTEAGITEGIGSSEYGEMAVAGFDRLGENVSESVSAGQPGAAREARAIGHGFRVSAGRGPWRDAL